MSRSKAAPDEFVTVVAVAAATGTGTGTVATSAGAVGLSAGAVSSENAAFSARLGTERFRRLATSRRNRSRMRYRTTRKQKPLCWSHC